MLEVPSPLPELWVMWAQQSLATASTRVSWGSWNYVLILLIRLPRPSLRGRARTAHTHTHTHTHIHTRAHTHTRSHCLRYPPSWTEIFCRGNTVLTLFIEEKKKRKEKKSLWENDFSLWKPDLCALFISYSWSSHVQGNWTEPQN